MPRVQQGASERAETWARGKYWELQRARAEVQAGVKMWYSHESARYHATMETYLIIYGKEAFDALTKKIEEGWSAKDQAEIDELVALHVAAWTEAHGRPPRSA